MKIQIAKQEAKRRASAMLVKKLFVLCGILVEQHRELQRSNLALKTMTSQGTQPGTKGPAEVFVCSIVPLHKLLIPFINYWFPSLIIVPPSFLLGLPLPFVYCFIHYFHTLCTEDSSNYISMLLGNGRSKHCPPGIPRRIWLCCERGKTVGHCVALCRGLSLAHPRASAAL